jgi:Fe-S-cluster containining protein
MDSNEWVSGQITVMAHGVPLKLNLTVPANPVKPQVMVPIFQKMANAFTDFGVKTVQRDNRTISCQKGCGACCRQPVPLTEVEIYYIAQLVEDLPEPRRSAVKQRFDQASAHFNSKGWLQQLESAETEPQVESLVLEYFMEGISCPFLEEESCSIHPDRPIICREYLVTSPAEKCNYPITGAISRVPLPLTATEGASRIGRTGKLSKRNYLPMVFALAWVQKHPEGFEEKTGEEWMADFFQLATTPAHEEGIKSH